MIDGIGDSHVIPIRTLSRTYNAKALNAKFAHVARQIRMDWNPATRKITPRAGSGPKSRQAD